MDTIRFLLGYIVRLVVILLLIAFVLWLVGLLYPQFKPSSLFRWNAFSGDWLPAPRDFSLLGSKTSDGQNGKVYVPGPAYNGYGNASYEPQEGVDFIVYTASGTHVIKAKGSGGQVLDGSYGYDNRSAYIRNLSVFQGGGITYGQRIVGEARESMFQNGRFAIYIVDTNKRLIGTAQAITTGTWSVPGWARFQATIPFRLPGDTYCSLVFQSATQPIQISYPVQCKN